jgi:hypothetical protein
MVDFDVVDLGGGEELPGPNSLELDGFSHDQRIRFAAALIAATAASSEGRSATFVTNEARTIEEYLRNG